MKIVHFLKHEISEVAAVTAYFLVAFGLIGLITKLMVLEYGLEFAGLARAGIGALLVGKVVVVLDKTKLGERFRAHAVWITVSYRSLVYTFFVFIVLGLERWFHGYREAGTLIGGIEHAFEAARLSRAVGIGLCVFVSFVGYGLATEVRRTVGRERLSKFLFDRDGRTLAD